MKKDNLHQLRYMVSHKKKISNFPVAWGLLISEIRILKNDIKKIKKKRSNKK